LTVGCKTRQDREAQCEVIGKVDTCARTWKVT